MIRTIISGAAVTTIALFASRAGAQNVPAVVWDVNDAIWGGTGCSFEDGDTAVLASGNDLSFIFSNLGVNLPGGSSNQLSARSNCVLRVPTEIAKGLYIGQLTQTLSYGITKTANTQGSVATDSSFFGYNVSPYTLTFPQGNAMNVAEQESARQDVFLVNTPWQSGWCSPYRPLNGLYGANIAVSGTRQSDMEDLIMFVDGLDLRWDILVAVYTC